MIKNTNLLITGTVLFAILVSMLVFYSVMKNYTNEIIENDWKYIEELPEIKTMQGKIFLIGSSQTGMINTTFVNDQLKHHKVEYAVWNISDGGDKPTLRLFSVDKIVLLQPKLVIYGIGFRDFEQQSMNNIQNAQIINSWWSLPTPQNLIVKGLNLESIEAQLGLPYSPKIITRKIIQSFDKVDEETALNKEPFTPLMKFGNDDYIIKDKSQLRQEIKNAAIFGGISDSNADVIAFKQIVSKFRQSNIKLVVFTTPYSDVALEKISESDKKLFEDMLEKISKEYNVEIYFLHSKYSDLPIWEESSHVALNKESLIYSQDILNIILNEIKE